LIALGELRPDQALDHWVFSCPFLDQMCGGPWSKVRSSDRLEPLNGSSMRWLGRAICALGAAVAKAGIRICSELPS
jgi:hypothetical protein